MAKKKETSKKPTKAAIKKEYESRLEHNSSAGAMTKAARFLGIPVSEVRSAIE